MVAATESDGRQPVVSLILLTAVTGFVDAASFLGLQHVFTGNMTGNVLLLGFTLGGAHDLSVMAGIAALAAFLVGATRGHESTLDATVVRASSTKGDPHRLWSSIFSCVTAALLLEQLGARPAGIFQRSPGDWHEACWTALACEVQIERQRSNRSSSSSRSGCGC